MLWRAGTYGDRIKQDRDSSLEAIRGIAALIVVCWHCLIAFYPERSGLYPALWPNTIQFSDSPWFGLLNGPAAVTVFFVLSGFVLTRQHFVKGDLIIPVRGALKRWPRLLGPVALAVALSYAAFETGAYRFSEAAQKTNSEWLRTFAYGIDPATFRPHFIDALAQGLFGTFFNGSFSYDSSLWTMKYELIGSFLVFGFSAISRPLLIRSRFAFLFLSAVVFALCHVTSERYVSFLAGALLAALLPREGVRLSWIVMTALALFAVYLLRFTDQTLAELKIHIIQLSSIDVQSLSATILIAIAVSSRERLQETPLATAGSFLGWISFPIYLVHVPMLCSVGCAIYLFADGNRALGVIATLVSAVLLSIPLAMFNDFWVQKVVNEGMSRWLTWEIEVTKS